MGSIFPELGRYFYNSFAFVISEIVLIMSGVPFEITIMSRNFRYSPLLCRARSRTHLFMIVITIIAGRNSTTTNNGN